MINKYKEEVWLLVHHWDFGHIIKIYRVTQYWGCNCSCINDT